MVGHPDLAPPGLAVAGRAPNWEAAERVRWVRGLQPLARRLLTELAWESDPHTGLVSPGEEALLAGRVESHVTSMRHALRGLIDTGHVQRVRRGGRGRPAVYRVTPRLPVGAPPRPAATGPRRIPAPVAAGTAGGGASRSSLGTTSVSPDRTAARAWSSPGPAPVGAGHPAVEVDPLGGHGEVEQDLPLRGDVLLVCEQRA
jgi:hypothetical protein